MMRTEQIIRPTGLLDPPIEVRPVEGQIDDLISSVNQEVEKGFKVLVTTLTKRMAEDLTDYMREVGIRVKYLHSDIDTLERPDPDRGARGQKCRGPCDYVCGQHYGFHALRNRGDGEKAEDSDRVQ